MKGKDGQREETTEGGCDTAQGRPSYMGSYPLASYMHVYTAVIN